MRLSIWRTWCYFEAQYMRLYMKNKVLLWSTSVEKEIVTLPFFLFFPFFWAFLFFGLSFSFSFFSLGNVLIMMIITLSLITIYELQLETRTRYDSIWMPPAVYRDGAMNQEWHVWKIMHGVFATNTMSTTWSCNGNMTKVKYVMMMMNGTVESCMAIYLGMAMEMP